MYAKHGKRGRIWGQSQQKHLESRLEVIQRHAFWDHRKADEGLSITL